ncbi:MAG: biotin/lipoyl-binding protein [Oscillospiraceae bacterium]|nr:biotin/lipoyl-binding protein [Oscillospiraceae bacterium]
MKYDVTLNGKVYEVLVERGDAILVSVNDVQTSAPVIAAAAAAPVAAVSAPAVAVSGALKGEPVNSPLPGVVIRVLVKTGERVKGGQPLIVLEAMKMENEITAPRDGVVAQIAVDKGSKVETGSALLSLE